MSYYNGKKVMSVVEVQGGGGDPTETPKFQANVTIIANALTNINGRVLSAYEATDVTISGYPAKKITYGGATLTEERARAYMEYMTGSVFLPKYNYEKPQNSIFLMSDYTLWKPQYDNTNGLLLYKMGQIAKQGDLNQLKNDLENGTLVVNKALSAKAIENVSENSGSTQTDPFIFQGSGTNNNTSETPTAPVAKHLEKQGHTLVVNQLVGNLVTNVSSPYNGISFTISQDGKSVTFNGTATQSTFLGFSYGTPIVYIAGHKYLVLGNFGLPNASFFVNDTSNVGWNKKSFVATSNTSGTSTGGIGLRIENGAVLDNVTVSPKLVDITFMEQSVIDDLTANPDHFSWYYNGSLDYNAGSLDNCDGEILETIEKNQFDEVMELGAINDLTGALVSNSSKLRSKNKIKVIPNREYYFKASYIKVYSYRKDNTFIGVAARSNNTLIMSSDVDYIRLGLDSDYGTTYKYDISMYLVYWKNNDDHSQGMDGDHYNTYLPFAKHTYNTGSEQLLAFDTKDPDGTWHKNTSNRNLAEMSFISGGGGQYYIGQFTTIKLPSDNSHKANMICDKYQVVARNDQGSIDKSIALGSDGYLYVKDTSLNSASEIAGNIQIELNDANKTTEQGTPFAENIIVDDYGTMGWKKVVNGEEVYVDIPQGCKFFYPADYVLLLDDLNNYLDGNDKSVDQLAFKNDLLPKLPNNSEDGTYTLKAVKSGNSITYLWVLDE